MTVIYPSPIFGPVHSRRLGVSLGINLMPADGKVCTFDCIYCECGFNADFRPKLPRPTREEVREALEARLRQMQAEGPAPDVLTFAGNGEPTAHPHFAEIMDDTLVLRDRYFPNAKVSVLSNSTMIHKPAVFEALKRVDNNILKLDSALDRTMRLLNRPANPNVVVEGIIQDIMQFSGSCIVQTMFLRGEHNGKPIDNTTDEEIDALIDAYRRIAPKEVMIYSIDRKTPEEHLEKVEKEELERIGARIKAAGFDVQVNA